MWVLTSIGTAPEAGYVINEYFLSTPFRRIQSTTPSDNDVINLTCATRRVGFNLFVFDTNIVYIIRI